MGSSFTDVWRCAMRRHVAELTISLIVTGFWTVIGPDSLVNAQTDCVTQSAVSPTEQRPRPIAKSYSVSETLPRELRR